MYTSFPSSSDTDLIQMYIFNYITDLTEWFSYNSFSLNMTKTDTNIFETQFSSINHSSFFTISTNF